MSRGPAGQSDGRARALRPARPGRLGAGLEALRPSQAGVGQEQLRRTNPGSAHVAVWHKWLRVMCPFGPGGRLARVLNGQGPSPGEWAAGGLPVPEQRSRLVPHGRPRVWGGGWARGCPCLP